MKAMVYNKIFMNGRKFAIAIDYQATVPDVASGITQKNESIIAFHPEIAKAVARDLNKLLEWYNTPYCQWAKRKSSTG